MENVNYDEFKNINDVYVSPKNGKEYPMLKAFRAHMSYKHYHTAKIQSRRVEVGNGFCQYCNKELHLWSVSNHEKWCYRNPKNLKLCLVCNKPIKNYRHSQGTCSCKCANSYFRSGINHGLHTGTQYTTICFYYHKKECIVCGEQLIVAVHHLDGNSNNHDPRNLVPLCPTHHCYWHSKHKDIIYDKVMKYMNTFITQYVKGKSHIQ